MGPNTARVILSSMEPNMIKQAIVSGEDLAFRKVKGVGPKTAQRIIVDLKDKFSKDMGFGALSSDPAKPAKNPKRRQLCWLLDLEDHRLIWRYRRYLQLLLRTQILNKSSKRL